METAANKLQHLLNTATGNLLSIPEDAFSHKPSPEKWSKKQVIGHLIDSAANNHQRFIRAQYENVPTIAYDQDKWNALNHYNEIEGRQLIHLWVAYNQHLIEIMKRITPNGQARECQTDDGKIATLRWLIGNYIVHLEHHLKQVVSL